MDDNARIDAESMGYDRFLRRGFRPPREITSDDAQIRTPQIPTTVIRGEIPQEQIERAINDVGRVSQLTTASITGLANGSTVTLTTTISDIVYPDKKMIAVPEITAYDGTLGSAAAIIRPNSNWRIDRGFDFHTNFLLASNGRSLTGFMSIYNESGSSKSIYWYIRWRFMGTNTSTAP